MTCSITLSFITCVVHSKELNFEITSLSTGHPPKIHYSLQSTSRFAYRDPFQYLSGKGIKWPSHRPTRPEPAGPAIGISKWNTFRLALASSNISLFFSVCCRAYAVLDWIPPTTSSCPCTWVFVYRIPFGKSFQLLPLSVPKYSV